MSETELGEDPAASGAAAAASVSALGEPAARRVGSQEDGTLNIDLGHVLFYDEGAQAFTDSQVSAYLEAPRRSDLGWYKMPSSDELANYRIARRGLDYLAGQGVRGPEAPDADGGYLVVLGVGLGLHVQRLLEELEVRTVILVEQYPEFVELAMRTVDWTAWRDIVEARGGRLHLILARDENTATNDLHGLIRKQHFGLIDGSYLFPHYQSSFMRAVLDELVSRVPIIAANPGFFEDELVMLRNCFRNLRRHEHELLQDKKRVVKRTPVIVVASGPSTDTAIDFVREYGDRAVVVSCGTGLGALLGYGIKPDFHVDTENTPGPLEILSGLAETHDLSGITLIACNTVDPGVPALFDDRVLYFRDSVSSTLFFGRDLQALYLTAPTVSNAAVRTMLGLGFREVYLVGVDFGGRDTGRHHSEKSIYVADESFLESHPEHKAATKYSIPRFGNFGGTVYANSSFVYASIFMANLMVMFPGAKVYNLSDGTRIRGTIPRLPEVAEIETDAAVKRADLRHARETLDRRVSYPGFTRAELERLRTAMHAAIDDLAAAFAGHRELIPLFDAIAEVFVPLRDTAIGRTVHAYLYGTALMLYQFLHLTYRRLPESARADFFAASAGHAVEELEIMRGQFDALADELIAELEAAD